MVKEYERGYAMNHLFKIVFLARVCGFPFLIEDVNLFYYLYKDDGSY